VKLALADPPYPPFIGSGGRKNRATRWYGNEQRSRKDRPADRHEGAAEWNDPARHRALLDELATVYDGWAISTSPDGLAAYGTLPVGCRIGAWIKPNSCPGSHRVMNMWEAVILYPPRGRRSNRGVGAVRDVWTGSAPRGFPGQKPEGYVHWLLSCLSYDPGTDTVEDLFPGSGAMARACSTYRLPA